MNTFADRLAKTITEIKNMKMNQVIGGDSWVVYRAEVVLPSQLWNREYRIIFSAESNKDFVAVCKETSEDRFIYGSMSEIYPDPNIPGVWWVPSSSATQTGTGISTVFFVYSTVKGTVSVQDVTGQGLGG